MEEREHLEELDVFGKRVANWILYTVIPRLTSDPANEFFG